MVIKVGCCGFPKAKKTYYQDFKVVEIQQTFYQIPRLETVRRWREEAPPDFEFSIKAWQLITHPPKSPTYRRLKGQIPEGEGEYYGFFKRYPQVIEAWHKTAEVARILRAKIIVFQCPPSFLPTEENKENLKHFFKSIEWDMYYFVWEPRGKWKEEEIKNLCEDLNLIHCVDPFKNNPLHGDIRYFRLHGKTGYKSHYNEQDLRYLKQICSKGPETYCMFNNVSMYEDALNFKRLIVKGFN